MQVRVYQIDPDRDQKRMEPEDISQEDVQADTGFIFYPL